MPLDLIPSQGGNLKLWAPPIHGRNYVMGVDVAEGKAPAHRFGKARSSARESRDFSCAIIIDRRSAQFMGIWHGYVDTTQLSHICMNLGMFYNQALIAVEVTGPGNAVQANLFDWGYPNFYVAPMVNKLDAKFQTFFGHKTTQQTRPLVIASIHEMLAEDSCDIPCEELLAEMRTMQFDSQGQERGIGANKDDRVFAYGIALRVRMEELLSSAPPTESQKYAHLDEMSARFWALNDKAEEAREQERSQEDYVD